jgi:hypothetical protein
MRKANGRHLDSGIYARIMEVQMSESDRRSSIDALRQAERMVDTFLWVREKLADIGHVFLKPSLKH